MERRKDRSHCWFEDVELYNPEEKYGWIPRLIFESACFTDAVDPDMRNWVVQIMDDMLLGPRSGRRADLVGKDIFLSSGGGVKNGDNCKKSEAVARRRGECTTTSLSVGMAMILHSIRKEEGEDSFVGDGGQSNTYIWMSNLLAQRASLKHSLAMYLDARSRSRKCTTGSEKALTTDAEAI